MMLKQNDPIYNAAAHESVRMNVVTWSQVEPLCQAHMHHWHKSTDICG